MVEISLQVAEMRAKSVEAYKEAERQRREYREEQDRKYREQELLRDIERMEILSDAPLFKEWFPDLEWELIDRAFPQVTGVVVTKGDAGDEYVPHFVITRETYRDGIRWIIKIAALREVRRYREKKRHAEWLVGATEVTSVSGVGQWFIDQDNVRNAVEEVARVSEAQHNE